MTTERGQARPALSLSLSLTLLFRSTPEVSTMLATVRALTLAGPSARPVSLPARTTSRACPAPVRAFK